MELAGIVRFQIEFFLCLACPVVLLLGLLLLISLLVRANRRNNYPDDDPDEPRW